jgi:hypothetical protein
MRHLALLALSFCACNSVCGLDEVKVRGGGGAGGEGGDDSGGGGAEGGASTTAESRSFEGPSLSPEEACETPARPG